MKDKEYYEEIYHKNQPKEEKKKRRRLQQKDTSKYKKSNLDQKSSPKEDFSDLPKGRVLTILADKIVVDHEKKEYLCSLKGSLKQEQTKEKTLITVGDFVRFKITDQEGQIFSVEPRFSYLSRIDVSGKKKQLMAANIEQALITASVLSPYLKPHLIDRLWISAKKGNMHPIILLNKIDLLDTAKEKEKKLYEEFIFTYQNIGISIISTSASTYEGIDQLKQIMKDQSSVFVGQSGVGKSSLINASTEHNLRTGTLVKKSSKGAHTTVKAQLLPLKEGGFCVDTPGIKSFGIWDLTKEDIVDHFFEIKQIAIQCHFPNCRHLNEPNCQVKLALEEGKVSSLRFRSYLNLIKEI